MANIVDNYLENLHEQAAVAKAGAFLGKEIMGAAAGGINWAAGTAAALLVLKTANATFSKATRVCGSRILNKHSPGFKICVARERIKALQQKINVYTNLLSKCNKDKNPTVCKQKYTIEITKAKNRILVNQNKIKQLLEENQQIKEQGALLAKGGQLALKGGTIALGLATMMTVDKSIFLLNRTIAASFSKASRQCGIYKDNTERKLCIAKVQLAISITKLNKLKGILAQCNKEKNVNKCKNKVNKHIEKTSRNIQILKDSITSYKNQWETEKREERLKAEMKKQSKQKTK